jgi:hypothetical protein
MPTEMLLLYAPGGRAARARGAAAAVAAAERQRLREPGRLVATGPAPGSLGHDGPRARRRDGADDGPFAVTKKLLGGHYALACRDLDEALKARRAGPARARWVGGSASDRSAPGITGVVARDGRADQLLLPFDDDPVLV